MSDIEVMPPVSRNGSGSAPEPERPRRKDPHLGLQFWVQLGQVEVAGFQECTGFGMETEVFEYSEAASTPTLTSCPCGSSTRTSRSNAASMRARICTAGMYAP